MQILSLLKWTVFTQFITIRKILGISKNDIKYLLDEIYDVYICLV